jgi:hypothetical protein
MMPRPTGATYEGEPMPSPTRTAIPRGITLLLAAILVAACAGGPQSQATTSEGPATPAASTAPATGAPASADPASEAPSEAIASPASTTPPPPLAVPAKPAKVTWKLTGSQTLTGGQTRETYRITWSAAQGAAATFSVYGVTECLRYVKQFDGKACVVKGMKIPKGTLKLIAEVPGSERSVDIAWKVGELGGGPYEAVLLRASNAAGDSIFTIAWSAAVCWHCTY